MVKESTYGTREIKQKEQGGGAVDTPWLIAGVIRGNPQFEQMDAIFGTLANNCINSNSEIATIGVTSANKGEGKTTIAMGLASTLASRGVGDVLLLECDLWMPTLAEDLGQSLAPGLAEYLREEVQSTDIFRKTDVDGLDFIPAGQVSGNADQLLRTKQLQVFFETIRFRYRYTVVDIPPILERPGAGRITDLTDGVVLVVAAGAASRQVTQAAVTMIGKQKVLGITLNRAKNYTPAWLLRLFTNTRATGPSELHG